MHFGQHGIPLQRGTIFCFQERQGSSNRCLARLSPSCFAIRICKTLDLIKMAAFQEDLRARKEPQDLVLEVIPCPWRSLQCPSDQCNADYRTVYCPDLLVLCAQKMLGCLNLLCTCTCAILCLPSGSRVDSAPVQCQYCTILLSHDQMAEQTYMVCWWQVRGEQALEGAEEDAARTKASAAARKQVCAPLPLPQ